MILFLKLFYTSLFFDNLNFLYHFNGEDSLVGTIHLEMSITMKLEELFFFSSNLLVGSQAIPLTLSRALV